MNLKRWSIVVILCAFIATIAGVSLEGAWAQETSQLQVTGSSGDSQLLAKGVGVAVPLNVTCSGAVRATYFEGSLQLRQRISKTSVATAGNYFSNYAVGSLPVCDGQSHLYFVDTLIPEPNALFKKGTALVTGSVYVCAIIDESNPDYPRSDCASSSFSQEVRIR